jgi:hypothetical protein
VTDMYRSVCIRQRGRDGSSLEMLFHDYKLLLHAKVRLFSHLAGKTAVF